jgi:hypothetical protein
MGLWGSLVHPLWFGRKKVWSFLQKKPRDPGSKQKQVFGSPKLDFDEIPGSPILFIR